VYNADFKHIAESDIACASASKLLRTEMAKKAKLQLGVTIPVYAITGKDQNLVVADYVKADLRKLGNK
jgi:hypothetical protein